MRYELKMWWIRFFCVIPTTQDAIKLGLTYSMDVLSDSINLMNCRSLWLDSKGRCYRVGESFDEETIRCKLCHYIIEPGHTCIDKLTDEHL